jgi:hypothetical protein
MKSLFEKLRFNNRFLPTWLQPEMTDKRLSLHNHETGSTFDGESTNADFARGDRRTAIMLDEFAAVENQREILAAVYDATDCAIAVSTHQGTATEFYKLNWPTIELHWSLHPRKAKGLYGVDDYGQPILIDKEHWTADRVSEYAFVGERPKNKKYNCRSPWYDAACRERQHAVLISQELDIDPEGSAYQFFDHGQLNKHEWTYCVAPFSTGNLDFDSGQCDKGVFEELAGGSLRLWCILEANGRPKRSNYVIGCDISSGTGASNSALSVLDRQTGEKVAEWVNSKTDPAALASIAIALCKWFYDAFLIWEANGPGRIFGGRIQALGYGNYFFKKVERSVSKKTTDVPGWYSTPEEKTELLGEYRRVLSSGEFINRSREAIDECRAYIVGTNGIPAHAASLDTSDPTGARNNHGDRVIADALCVRGSKEVSPQVVEKPKDFEIGSFGWRRQQRKNRRRLEEYVL